MAKDHLIGKERLQMGQKLVSLNNRYTLVVQNDGNVVLYDTHPKNVAIWSTGTKCKSGKHFLCMQSDQNIVLYNDSVALWNSKTRNTNVKNIVLVLQNDGNLVGFGDDKQFWASHTSENHRIEKQLKEQKETTHRVFQQQAKQMRRMQLQLEHQQALARFNLHTLHRR